MLDIENREQAGRGVASRLDADAGLAPMSPLGVVAVSLSVRLSIIRMLRIAGEQRVGEAVPDGVARPQADPLRDGAVLLLSFGKLLLGAEGLVALRSVSIAIVRV